jgi:hypothetical protein
MTSKQATPNEILKTYPLYKVCTQVTEHDDIVIRQVRCPDTAELMEFLKRLLKPTTIGQLAFFEVHQIKADGTIDVVLGDINKPFPKVRHQVIGGIISPKIPQVEGTSVIEEAGTRFSQLVKGQQSPAVIVQEILKLKSEKQIDEVGRAIHPRPKKEA